MNRLIAKVVFGGDGGVGKTTLIQRYLTGEFIDTTKLTIGVGFHLHQMSYQENEISLSVWDLGGQEQFKQMGIFGSYFRGALVAVLMFDLTRSLTIKGLESWASFVDKDTKTALILVGGKSDLPRDPLIDDEMINYLIEHYKVERYIETSSANGLGVNLVFNEIARLSSKHVSQNDSTD